MRKLFVAIATAMSVLSVSADVTYKYDSSTKTLTFSGTGKVPDITLWNEDGVFSEWNSQGWTDYQELAEKVVFEEGITALGGCVLNDFENVTEVSLPSTLTDLGMGAFRNMTSLKSIDLPAGLKTIGMRCFEESGLESIVIPDGVTKFELETFRECESLKSVEAKNVTEYGVSVFYRTAIKNFTIPEGTKVIPAGMFYAVKTMMSVIIPASVETIDKSSFANTKLEKVVFKGDKLPKFVEKWGKEYYVLDEDGNILLDEDGYERTKSIYWGLGGYAFSGWIDNERYFYLNCSALTDEAIQTVKDQNDYSYNVSVLPLLAADINFDIDYNVKNFKIEQKDCSKNVLTFSATPASGKCLVWSGSVADGLEDKSVESFDYEVTGAASLEGNVQKCGGASGQVTWSFDEITKTLNISGNDDTDYKIPSYASGDATPWAQYADQIENVEFGYYVYGIGDHAFDGLTKVTTIELPVGANTIGNYAFDNMPSLTKIKFIAPKYAEPTIPTITENSFSGLGDDVQIIVACDYIEDYQTAWPDYASRMKGYGSDPYVSVQRGSGKGSARYTIVDATCDEVIVRLIATPEAGESFLNWKFVYSTPTIVSGTETDSEIEVKLGTDDILNVTAQFTGSLTSGTDGNISWRYDAENDELIISGEGEMDDYYYENPWVALDDVYFLLTKITVEEGITYLGAGAFMDMESVTSLTLPKSLVEIGEASIYGMESLKSVVIPENVTNIDDYNFVTEDWFGPSTYFEKIEFKGSVPPTIEDGTIENLQNTGKVVYPCASKAAYEEAFADIDESKLECSDGAGDTPGLDDFTFDPANVCGAEGDGSNILWAFDEATGTLALKGTGKMKDYTLRTKSPWNDQKLAVKKLIMSDDITTVGEYAFYETNTLEEIVWAATMDTIYDHAFEGTLSLKKLVLPNSVRYLSSRSFYSTGATEVTLSNSLKTIGQFSFQYTHFSKIVIPASVTFIARGAFEYSETLEDIIFEGTTPPETGGYSFVSYARGSRIRMIVPCESVEAYKSTPGYGAEMVQGEYPYSLEFHEITEGVKSDLGGNVWIKQWPDCESGEAVAYTSRREAYDFSHWEAIGVTLTEEQSKMDTLTFTVDDDCILIAVFKIKTNVDNVDADNVVVNAADGRITVNRSEFNIYDILGRDVTSSNGSLTAGIYVVKCEGKAYKAVVK